MKSNQTGPITVQGKKKSSKNAIKHGATSAKLITSEEQDRYETLVIALNNQYQSSNPLVQLQINRVARITIQLERIQNVIDASFKKSRMRGNTIPKVLESYKQQSAQIEDFAGRLFDANSRADLEKTRAIAFELINAQEIIKVDSHELLKDALPLLNAYFEEKERSSGLSIKEILLTEVCTFSEAHKSYCDAIREQDQIEKEMRNSESYQQLINRINLNLIKMFALWHRSMLRDFFVGPESDFTVQESIRMEEEAMLPDSQEMDRLMRYQTTLQRQLSSAIGELLAIKKVDDL